MRTPRVNRFFAHFLFILAAWTLVIKYVFPMTYAIFYGLPIGSHVYPDLWPVVHVWLGWSLLHWRRSTFVFAVGISVAEIVIVISKFVSLYRAYFAGPFRRSHNNKIVGVFSNFWNNLFCIFFNR